MRHVRRNLVFTVGHQGAVWEEKYNYLPNANDNLLNPLSFANALREKILLTRAILSTAFLRYIEARKEGRKTSIAMR